MFKKIGAAFYIMSIVLVIYTLLFADSHSEARSSVKLVIVFIALASIFIMLDGICSEHIRGGKPRDDDDTIAICPYCGKFVKSTDSYCKFCGGKINVRSINNNERTND